MSISTEDGQMVFPTVIPKSVVEGLGLPSLGNCSFTMVDGSQAKEDDNDGQ